jgi:hypothetical protein
MPGKCYVSLSALSGVFSIFTPVVLGLSVASLTAQHLGARRLRGKKASHLNSRRELKKEPAKCTPSLRTPADSALMLCSRTSS